MHTQAWDLRNTEPVPVALRAESLPAGAPEQQGQASRVRVAMTIG